MAEGVDYAWDRPTVSGLVAAGKRFAVRYGGPGSSGKQLDAAEMRALTAAGIAVVANAEGSASGLKGRTAGIAWAKDADAHFRGLGMPSDRPIYFSADWDVLTYEYVEVDAALRGCAEVIGAARVGLYGGRRIIEHCKAAGTARWLWQTYAWSSGIWVPGVHLQQYRNGVSLAGGTVDLNRSMAADYGQWGTIGTPTTGDDMSMADLAAEDVLSNGYPDASANPKITFNTLAKNLATHTYDTWQTARRTEAALKTLQATVSAMAASGDDATLQRIEQTHQEAMQRLTDMEAREQARESELLASFRDALPAGTDPVTREELTAALTSVFGQAFGQTTTETDGQA